MSRKANTRKARKANTRKINKRNTRKRKTQNMRKNKNTRRRKARGNSPILDTLKTISLSKNDTLELYLYKETMKKMTKEPLFDKTIENSIRYLVEKTNNHTLEKILNRIIRNTSYNDNVVLCKFLFEIIEGVDVTKKRNFKTTFCRCVDTLTEIMKAWGDIDNKNRIIKTPSLSGGGGGKRIIILLIILGLLYFLYTSFSFVEQDVKAIVGTMKNRKEVVATQAAILSDVFKRIHGKEALKSLTELFNKYFSFDPDFEELQYEEFESPLAIGDGQNTTQLQLIASPRRAREVSASPRPGREVSEDDETKGVALITEDIVPFRGIERIKKDITLINPAQVPVLVNARIQENINSFFADATKLISELLRKKGLKCSQEFQERAPMTTFELVKRGLVEAITGNMFGEASNVATRLQQGLDDCINRNEREFHQLTSQLDALRDVSQREAHGLARDVQAIVKKTTRGGQSVYYSIGIASTLIYFINNMRYLNN